MKLSYLRHQQVVVVVVAVVQILLREVVVFVVSAVTHFVEGRWAVVGSLPVGAFLYGGRVVVAYHLAA